jgi:decaprenylphospho-beta-D-erythro-pentofuranosid-2-ulose 2-reductase
MRDSLGAVQSVLVLGGASEIGVAIAAGLAGPRQATVILAGRHPAALDAAAETVRAAGAARVETLAFDADDTAGHAPVLAEAAALAGRDLDVVVLAFGVLGAERAAGTRTPDAGAPGPDPAGLVAMARTNYVGTVSAGLAAAHHLRGQGHGAIVVLSSVAGVRVRRANFVYGSSKAGVDGFARGLADSLRGSGVQVLVVRPGFVRTRMTEGLPDAPLATTAGDVAAATVAALAAGKELVWVPRSLGPMFTGLRHLPGAVWRRLPG